MHPHTSVSLPCLSVKYFSLRLCSSFALTRDSEGLSSSNKIGLNLGCGRRKTSSKAIPNHSNNMGWDGIVLLSMDIPGSVVPYGKRTVP